MGRFHARREPGLCLKWHQSDSLSAGLLSRKSLSCQSISSLFLSLSCAVFGLRFLLVGVVGRSQHKIVQHFDTGGTIPVV
jgi:hypothetical protein